MLVSTTIIENGLDISNANTLIVEDATLLGLSSAHQIRGRIGRGDKTAFAYLLFGFFNADRTNKADHTINKHTQIGSNCQKCCRYKNMVARSATKTIIA